MIAALISIAQWAAPAAAASSCGPTVNLITCENSQTSGVTDDSKWDIDGAGDSDIQGFSTDISANAGTSIGFKINTTLAYSIDVYRLGYYGGAGARLWQGNLAHSAPVKQPNCLTDASTLLYDCGNWSVGATWSIPSNAVSGVYIAKLTATNGDASHITFIVRNDASTSDIVYQTSDETWEAYNTFGGSDFYTGTTSLTGTQARAFKVSYNRPFATRGATDGRDFLFSNEYPTIRFLERNGYDVSYIAGVDADRSGALLLNHKTYLSVGHDEYWSEQQRKNVENARDHGVNLMFLSGNEVYWHTRFEASIDGSNTSYRTLVCYKDTWDDAKIDPSAETTSTWRDPRFGTAPNSAEPENSLTGTMYMSNSDDLAVTVTAAQGKMRLWRNTGLGSMTGASTALAPHTIGYESDEDIDNGFRPAGLVDLSTTVGATPQYLQDFGSTVLPGTTTHHLTLYRASSGALVFGAGTIQWGWGLDQTHDGDNSNPADPRMQQATMNVLADMQTLPTTLMAGMVMPTPSSDTQAPTVNVTSPTAGATIANGTQITVAGTATDVGGGQVAGVEVSLDAGGTWHPAAGTNTWTYTGIIHGTGTSSVQVRATDDSANTSTPTSIAQTVTCPCSLFGNTIPATPDGGDSSGVELGVRFSSSIDGYVSGVRFYKASTNTGSHIGSLWSSSGTLLANGTFVGESASGWQTLQFASPVAITANTTYVVSYFAPNGHYSVSANYFYYSDYSAPPLLAQTTSPKAVTANGVYSDSHSFPSSTYHAGNYFVDVLFSGSAAVAPSVVGQTPTPGASSISASATPTATFSKAMNSSTIAFVLTDSSNNSAAGSVSYDSASKTATFTPTSALTAGTLYTVTVTGSDTNGNALSSPATWNFRTAYPGQVGGACPCTIFSDSSVPATPTVQDSGSVELGIKFTADTDGIVTGVRFYKGSQNTGSHTGSLWSATGQQLATATFTNESTTGWQTVTFANPVSVTAGTTYVASYHTTVGYYSATAGAYASTGVDNFPLHVPVNGSVYTYSTAFPNSGSTADYGVDVVFTVSASVVPSVTSSDPGSGDFGISTGSSISATFNTSILAGTTTMVVTPSGGSPIAGTAALDSVHRVLTFTPSAPLATGTAYSVSVSGARSLAGTLQASASTWSFGTAGGTTCPCSLFPTNATPATIDSGDSSAITVGTQLTSSVAGFVTGIRFYKSTANTGTHTGSIWNVAGTRLATATFTNETASGWQSVAFSQPVAITAGAVYTIGYYAPSGHYSATSHYFDTPYSNGVLSVPATVDGVYRYGSDGLPTNDYQNTNYWVDAVFATTVGADTTPPTITASNPIDGATSVTTSVAPSAVFSEPVSAASVVFTLTDPSSNAVSGAVTYDGPSQTATFTPTSTLVAGTKYTGTVSASDTSGNAMPSGLTWSFTTAQNASTACPCSVFTDATTPSVITDSDSRSVELGALFSADTSGQVVGARFYKGPGNTGTHTATLWTSTGQQLATGTFTGESSTGWQSLTFAAPVTITAGTTYVISYHASVGGFSATPGAFSTAGVDNSPLHLPAHAGLYLYGASAFPSNTSDANYFADVLFQPGAADTTAPVISAVTAAGAGSTATITWTTDEAASTQVAYGTSANALNQSATVAGQVTSHSLQITGLTSAATYYFRVTSADASGNTATSPIAANSPATFTTGDTVAPVVSAVAAAPAGTTASVTWTTDEAASSRVDYGTSPTALTSTASTAGLSTTHSVGLTGLSSSATYYYRVTSADASGNSTTSPAAASAPATFKASDTVPPTITGVAASGSGTTASVTWTTNEVASSRVDYGTSATTLTSTASATGLSTAHSVGLTGLASGTKYYYRVTSVDASGNSATSPTAANAPKTFTAVDTTPPTITAVAASGSGTTASVTWTTDEASTSKVSYGTSATSLTSSASASGSVTAHTVSLKGLTANTRYYYRVTSVDPAGNSSTSPVAASAAAVYVPTTTPFVDTTTANFNSGTSSSTYVTAEGDGGVVLAPTRSTDFTATTVPSGWTSTATVSGGSTTYAGGYATVKGANLYTSSSYTVGKSVEVQATLSQNQSIGWAVSATSATRFAFSVDSSNELIATVNDGSITNVTSVLAAGWTPTPHKFRIEWNSGTVTFYLDDVSSFTQTFSNTFTTSMRPVFSDTVVNDAGLILDWARVGPYAASGTYTSRIVNASAPVSWDGLTWDATVPTGTTLTVSVRTGSTATPDGTWSAYATIPASGGSINTTSRYLQYQLTFTSTGTRYVTPTVRSVQLAFHV